MAPGGIPSLPGPAPSPTASARPALIRISGPRFLCPRTHRWTRWPMSRSCAARTRSSHCRPAYSLHGPQGDVRSSTRWIASSTTPNSDWCMAEVDIFADLDEAEMNALAASRPRDEAVASSSSLVYSPHRRPNGDVIILEGRPGAASSTCHPTDGRSPATILAPSTIFGDDGPRSADRCTDSFTEALDDVAVCVMTRKKTCRRSCSASADRRRIPDPRRRSRRSIRGFPTRSQERAGARRRNVLVLAGEQTARKEHPDAHHQRALRHAGRHLPRDHHRGARRLAGQGLVALGTAAS